MTLLLAVAVLLMARAAAATWIQLSGFDLADQSTSDTDSYEWLPRGTSDASVDLVTAAADARVHRTSNGGDDSSKWSLKATVATGQYGYVMLSRDEATPQDFPGSFDAWFAANIHVAVAPATGQRRIIMATVESSASDPPDGGCSLALNGDRSLTLFYSGGTGGSCTLDTDCASDEACVGGICRKSWGTTSRKLYENACSTDMFSPCTAATVSSDCPGSAPTCPTTQYYWGGLTLRQVSQSIAIVECELYWDGRPVFAGVAKTIPGSPVQPAVSNVAVGVTNLNTTTGGATIYADDVAVTDGENPGYGYVARKVPQTLGVLQAWNERTCSANPGNTGARCVNDYAVNSFLYFNDVANNTVERANANRGYQFGLLTPTLTLPTGAKVDAIESVIVGADPTGSGTRQIALGLMACPIGACAGGTCQNADASGRPCTSDAVCCVDQLSPQEILGTGAGSTTIRVRKRFMSTAAPIASTDTTWTQYLNAFGIEWMSGPLHAANMRIGAAVAYVRIERIVKATPTLVDHNVGADDGQITVCAIGDSTLVGTVETACIGGDNDGVECTQASYCAGGTWSAAERDKPTGGCDLGTAATYCDTCTIGRLYFPGGLGLQCTVNTDCTANTCDTTAGYCDKPDGTQLPVPCTTNASCNLGTCDTGATCLESCPNGGVCPSGRTGWAGNISSHVTADNVIACGLGGEQIGQMVKTRFDKVLVGLDDNCEAKGGSGVCQCLSATDCAASGGTCAGGLCVTGDANKTSCTKNTDCAGTHPGGLLCKFPPCDYVVILEGYNDKLVTSPGSNRAWVFFTAPGPTNDLQCRGLRSMFSYAKTSTAVPCPDWGSGAANTYTVPTQNCIADSQCTASPAQHCAMGWCTDAGSSSACWTNTSVNSQMGCTSCSVMTNICPNNGGFCGMGTGKIGACYVAPDKGTIDGQCQCGDDTGCISGYACVGDSGGRYCRKTCTTSSDCMAPQSTCVSASTTYHPAGAVNVCEGRCSAPCDAVPCTADWQCGPPPGGVTPWDGFYGRTNQAPGICNYARGRCASCGVVSCEGRDITQAACSCSVNSDCDSSAGAGDGACDPTFKQCRAPIAKTACMTDADCAPAPQRCLRPNLHQNTYTSAFQNVPIDADRYMVSDLAVKRSQGDATLPTLLFAGLPMLNGQLSGGNIVADRECQDNVHFARAFIDQITSNLLASEFPARHVITFRANWDQERMTLPYHSDAVHYSPLGANRVGQLVSDALNRLNVCVKSDGTAQLYCQNPNGTFAATTCVTVSDCSSGQFCTPRPCFGLETNCPDGADTCNGD